MHPALPVSVTGPRHVVTQVSAWVEARLGWQVTTGGDLPAVVGLRAVDASASTDIPGALVHLPTVALVGPDDDPVAAARLSAVCDAVIAWPVEHDTLMAVVSHVVAEGTSTSGRASAPGRQPGSQPVGQPGSFGPDRGTADSDSRGRPWVSRTDPGALVVGGACGGAGTTTVAITLAAWHVWRRDGGRAMAVVSGPTPLTGALTVGDDVLAGHRGWAAATPVPDVSGLRVVRAMQRPVRLMPPDDVAAVMDVGVVTADDEQVDVLVARRDAAGLAAVTDTSCGIVVVADDGPVPRSRMEAAAAGRRVVVVPWSVRVARAHALGRVPGSLPARYTAALGGLGGR